MQWVTFSKRTTEPRLSWLERQLDEHGIPHRRIGHNRLAPIVEVPEEHEAAACDILVRSVEPQEPRWPS